jgi:hypothetical protein
MSTAGKKEQYIRTKKGSSKDNKSGCQAAGRYSSTPKPKPKPRLKMAKSEPGGCSTKLLLATTYLVCASFATAINDNDLYCMKQSPYQGSVNTYLGKVKWPVTS